MSEIFLGSGGDESDADGGGSVDILGQLEEMKSFVEENPQFAKLLGVDMGELEGMSQDIDTDGKPDVEMLLSITESLIEAGFGDRSVQEIHTYVENNREQVSNLIEKRV